MCAGSVPWHCCFFLRAWGTASSVGQFLGSRFILPHSSLLKTKPVSPLLCFFFSPSAPISPPTHCLPKLAATTLLRHALLDLAAATPCSPDLRLLCIWPPHLFLSPIPRSPFSARSSAATAAPLHPSFVPSIGSPDRVGGRRVIGRTWSATSFRHRELMVRDCSIHPAPPPAMEGKP